MNQHLDIQYKKIYDRVTAELKSSFVAFSTDKAGWSEKKVLHEFDKIVEKEKTKLIEGLMGRKDINAKRHNRFMETPVMGPIGIVITKVPLSKNPRPVPPCFENISHRYFIFT